MSEEEKNSMNIQLDPEVAEGTYSNLALIAHTDSEFILDFINMMAGTNQGKVKSRIIVTPQHAKRLAKALLENIQKFERQYGEIKVNEPQKIPLSFNGITGEA